MTYIVGVGIEETCFCHLAQQTTLLTEARNYRPSLGNLLYRSLEKLSYFLLRLYIFFFTVENRNACQKCQLREIAPFLSFF